jgi:uncharacterized protein (UPF0261 family)
MISILVIGTCDTKAGEMRFLKSSIEECGARAVVMDVDTGESAMAADVSNAEVARGAGLTIEELRRLGDENAIMTRMAQGASAIARGLRVDGMIALGGTMGTDLALDVALALPVGMPKMIVSSVAFSPLIPPDRVAPDLMMMLWPGGLFGLNSVSRSALRQAAGAIVGAASAPAFAAVRPMVAITSLGKSCLRYMLRLVPALEARGFEAVVFHSTGMGGRAFESMAAQRRFAAVLDLCLQEVGNHFAGSVVSAGASRLEAAGRAGTPQIVAPGAIDMVDFPAWSEPAERFHGRAVHAHNRLIASAASSASEREEVARVIAEKLAASTGPVKFVLPLRGVEEWDRGGAPLHDPQGLDAFVRAARAASRPPVELIEVDAHINDDAFADRVLAIFDEWVAAGVVRREMQDA